MNPVPNPLKPRAACPACHGTAQALVTGMVRPDPVIQCICGALGPSRPGGDTAQALADWNAWAKGVG